MTLAVKRPGCRSTSATLCLNMRMRSSWTLQQTAFHHPRFGRSPLAVILAGYNTGMDTSPSDLSPVERRALQARAHALHPVVSIGEEGLTPSVLHEIDVNLLAHELIKIRVFNDLRGAREALLHQLCEVL